MHFAFVLINIILNILVRFFEFTNSFIEEIFFSKLHSENFEEMTVKLIL